MTRRRQNIAAQVEYAEINALARAKRKPAPVKPAAAEPETVDCSDHDARCRAIFAEYGLMALHPQDKRLSAQLRLLLKFEFWNILKGRRK